MSQFAQNLKKIVSNKDKIKRISNHNTLNQNELFIQTKPKQELRKKIKQKKQKLDKEYRQLFLNQRYKTIIKKYNVNIFNILRILKQNQKIIKQLEEYPIIMKKIANINNISRELNSVNNFIIFLQDIDKEIFQNKINGGR